MLLSDPSGVPISAVPVGDPLPPAPPVPVERQPCLDIQEPLVALDGLPVLDAYEELGILPGRHLKVRESVRARLHAARSHLDAPFDLTILDGSRTLDEQRKLLDHYRKSGPTGGFVASVGDGSMRPPHTTGGAVDLTLSWQGRPLALGTDFDSFSEEARLHAFEPGDGIVTRLRRLLASCLTRAGFAPYELEWWHWSHGDDVWASTYGKPALYEIVDPEAFS